MVVVKKVVLDVLKPHIPKGLELATAIAEQGEDYHVTFTVEEVDEKTETVVIVIEGEDIRMEAVENTINSMGASLHSIDEVEVVNLSDTE
jgi:hypothetical protein